MMDFKKWRERFFSVSPALLKPHQLVESYQVIVNRRQVMNYQWSGSGQEQYRDQSQRVKILPCVKNSQDLAQDARKQGAGPFLRDHPEADQAW